MKKIILFTAILAMAASAASAQSKGGRMLNPDNPEDALEIAKRVQCGEADGKPAVYHWAGKIYSRVQGEPDRHLFNGEGMNIRQCVSVDDPKRGKGWRVVR